MFLKKVIIAFSLMFPSCVYAQEIEIMDIDYILPPGEELVQVEGSPHATTFDIPVINESDDPINQHIRELLQESNWNEVKDYAIAWQVLNMLDGVTTIACLESNNCVELNPILGRDPSPEAVALYLGAGGILMWILMREISERDPKVGRNIAIFNMVFKATVVGNNLRFSF